jgi:hypothetical protein
MSISSSPTKPRSAERANPIVFEHDTEEENAESEAESESDAEDETGATNEEEYTSSSEAKSEEHSDDEDDIQASAEALKKLVPPYLEDRVESEDGDIIDYVDIYKQPAFNHPSLKNHNIQMRPSYYPNKKRSRISKWQQE